MEVAGCMIGSETAPGSRTSFLAVVKGRLAPLCDKNHSYPDSYGAAYPVVAALQYQREKRCTEICSTNAISFLLQELTEQVIIIIAFISCFSHNFFYQ